MSAPRIHPMLRYAQCSECHEIWLTSGSRPGLCGACGHRLSTALYTGPPAPKRFRVERGGYITTTDEETRIERWDERDDGDEDSEVILSGPSINHFGAGFAVRVRDCHQHWGPLQGILPDECLTDELYARMCAAVGLNPNHGDDHDD